MSNQIVNYCKGSRSIKLCCYCKSNYTINKETIDKALNDKSIKIFKIDDTECERNNAKYFSSLIVN